MASQSDSQSVSQSWHSTCVVYVETYRIQLIRTLSAFSTHSCYLLVSESVSGLSTFPFVQPENLNQFFAHSSSSSIFYLCQRPTTIPFRPSSGSLYCVTQDLECKQSPISGGYFGGMHIFYNGHGDVYYMCGVQIVCSHAKSMCDDNASAAAAVFTCEPPPTS